jgi:hypothetical protein
VAPEAPKVDAAGVPFDPAIHTGTLRKDGTWRLRKGAKSQEPETGEQETEEPETEEPELDLGADPVPQPAETDEAVGEDKPVSDMDLQRFCAMVAAKLGGAAQVYEIASAFVPAGEVPRPSNIKDNATRWQFVRKAEQISGVRFFHV